MVTTPEIYNGVRYRLEHAPQSTKKLETISSATPAMTAAALTAALTTAAMTLFTPSLTPREEAKHLF